MSIPIIRLEIESMKHSLIHAMGEHIAHMDADIQAAIEGLCTPENIAAIINETAGREIRKAIETEIHSFYQYGKGRAVIRDAVLNSLSKETA